MIDPDPVPSEESEPESVAVTLIEYEEATATPRGDVSPVKVSMRTKEIDTDPRVRVYYITIEDGTSILHATYGDRELADAFIEGMRVAFRFTDVGYMPNPQRRTTGE